MPTLSPAQRTARAILIGAALLLPTLSLVPLGGLYLYANGWLLHWAVAALVVAGAAFLIERSWLRSGERRLARLAHDDAEHRRAGRLTLADRAWADVRAIAKRVDIDRLQSTEAVLALGQRTIDAVARRMHPEKPDAVWRFTLPEALVITERVSARLGRFVETQIPFGDRLTMAQFLTIYRWRGMVGVAERAYDVWRVVRMANPATAVTHEAREQLSRAVLNWSKERVGRRLAEAYVEEVGRAAIDLYGGRLRPHGEAPSAASGPSSVSPDAASGRLRVLVAGATRDRVVVGAALAAVADLDRASDAEWESAPAPSAIVTPSPRLVIETSDAIGETAVSRRQLLRSVRGSDVVVWCVAARPGVAAGDDAALDVIRTAAASAKLANPVAIVVAVVSEEAIAAEDVERLAAPLITGMANVPAPPPIVIGVVPVEPRRTADAERLAAAVAEQAVRARAMATAAFDAGSGARGVLGSARQAVSAAGALAGHMLRRR
jgi:hypothetical protein